MIYEFTYGRGRDTGLPEDRDSDPLHQASLCTRTLDLLLWSLTARSVMKVLDGLDHASYVVSES